MIDIVLSLLAATALPSFDQVASSEQAPFAQEDPASEQTNQAEQEQRFAPQPDQLSAQWPVELSEAGIGDRQIGVVALQALLDRSPHSPGVVDGYEGGNTKRAISAYRQANGLSSGSEPDRALWDSLISNYGSGPIFTTYAITSDDADGPFYDIPADFAAKAELERLGYEDVVEMLSERFHMDQKFLRFLNPQAQWSAGETINVVAQPDTSIGSDVQRIEVDKAAGAVRAYDGNDNLLATYPATIGSDDFPSPSGTMEVKAVAPEPKYYFDPEGRAWGPERQLTIAPGPNNPVGGTWIDLSKEGYGIHGSPDPQLTGKTSSHGCVRLTNWDADELAKAVVQGARVTFS